MDRITKSLLDEFSKQHALLHLPEDKQFEHFASYLSVQRLYGETFDTNDIVIGDGNDTGIDAIAIIVNGVLVTESDTIEDLAESNGYLEAVFIFVQAERSASFETAKIGQFSFGVADFFSVTPSLKRNPDVEEASAIMSAIFAQGPKLKRGNPSCKMYYVTTGKWQGDINLEARRKAAIADIEGIGLFKEVEFVPVDTGQIQRLYSQSINALSREFIFSERTVIPEIPGVKEAYLGLIPAPVFISILTDEGGQIAKSLFYDNVRDWQDFNPVNSEMRETLESDVQRTRFALMNNGVTIIAKTLRATGNKFYIEDFQIVNGCQTSHVMFSQREKLTDETVMVPLRLISTQDEEITAAIIKATNRQTEVKSEQLLAISNFQKRMELFFLTFENDNRLFYERRSRQYNNMPGIEKTRIVLPSGLIRAFSAMFLDQAHRTTRNYKALVDQVGTRIFNEDHKLEPYYLAAFASYRLEYFFRSQSIDTKFKRARHQILFASRLLADIEMPTQFNSREMERYAMKLIESFWDSDKAEKLLKLAAEVVDTAASGNLDKDNVRTQPFTEKVRTECLVRLGKTIV